VASSRVNRAVNIYG